MQINSYTPAYIFALNFSGYSDDSAAEQQSVASITGRTPVQAQGYYEGAEERSYIVVAEDFNARRPAFLELLNDADQDAVLFLDNQRVAYLYFREDGYQHGPKAQVLGVFKEVHPTVVPTLSAWTKIGDKYFAAR